MDLYRTKASNILKEKEREVVVLNFLYHTLS